MKVSYIILPFEDPTYLVRCVNSLYRQLGEDFEVVLAENDFGYKQEEIEEFLGDKTQVKKIAAVKSPEDENSASAKLSYAEKLDRAFSLISADSSHVMLVGVDTVVSPVCAKDILKCENSDLIILSAAVKNCDEFDLDRPEISDFKRNFNQYCPQRFCFAKELFEDFKPEYIDNNKLFSFFMLKAFVKGINVAVTEDVVIYVQPFFAPEQSEKVDFGAVKEQSEFIISNLNKINNKETKASVLQRAVGDIIEIMNCSENINSQEAYGILQSYCREIKDDFVMKKVFEETVGFEAEVLLLMDYEQFAVYRTYVRKTVSSSATDMDLSEQNELLKDMKTALDVTKKELSDLKKDVLAIKAKPFTVAMPATATGTVISDPYTDIPQMYREGRLGLKTIIRSFNSWLKYKTGRKK